MISKVYEYDVFISYAVEDKIDIITDLVEKLKEAGVKVWYAGQQLIAGHDVEEMIRDGLAKSRHGIVVLSHNYFAKDWPRRELHALWGRENSKERKIFPVWHKITKEEIELYDPLLGRNWGITTEKGVDFVVKKLVETINHSRNEPFTIIKKEPGKISLRKIFIITLITLIASVLVYYFLIWDVPSNKLINNNIEQRITTLQNQIDNQHTGEMNRRNGSAATIEQVQAYFERYNGLKSQFRNIYSLNTGYADISHKKNVASAIGMDPETLDPHNSYGFKSPAIFVIDEKPSPHTMDVKYIFLNSKPVTYKIVHEEKPDDFSYVVSVAYTNPIRYLAVDLIYSKRSDWMKQKETALTGLLPLEKYHFTKKGNDWVFAGLDNR